MTKIFGTDGIRCLVNQEPLTVETSLKISKIVAYLLTLNGTGWKLWPVFGASNQMLAALTLMVLSLYFWKKGRNILPLLLPMLFIMVITITIEWNSIITKTIGTVQLVGRRSAKCKIF